MFLSCESNEQKNKTNTDTILHSENVPAVMKDTTITYYLEGISSEGAEAKVLYNKGRIRKAEIGIAGAEGQCFINYVFQSKVIEVGEKCYHYKAGIESVNKNEMSLKSDIHYTLGYDGKPIGKEFKERLDIFQEFKKAVPFKLK
jgi:hypothetical protein